MEYVVNKRNQFNISWGISYQIRYNNVVYVYGIKGYFKELWESKMLFNFLDIMIN